MKQKIRLLNGLEQHLKDNIKGQNFLMSKICNVLKRGELALPVKGRPKGSFLFLGTTGVGKTEITKTFTHYLFGDNKLHRFDMSEFMEMGSIKEFKGDIDRLGRLGTILEEHTHGTLLFDEMEKAEKKILDLFLQILDYGKITLGNGKLYDVSNFYIVFTSNIGSERINQSSKSPHVAISRAVMSQVQRRLRPEFIARIGEENCIVFKKLEYDVQREIAILVLEREITRLKEMGYLLEYDPGIVEFLIRKGIDIRNGARPMRDCVERYLQNAVMEPILEGIDQPCGLLKQKRVDGIDKLVIEVPEESENENHLAGPDIIPFKSEMIQDSGEEIEESREEEKIS